MVNQEFVDNLTNEKAIQEALDGLAWVIIKMYQLDHPLPNSESTLPLYNAETAPESES